MARKQATENEESARKLEQAKSTIDADIAAWKRENYGIFLHCHALCYAIAIAIGIVFGLVTPRSNFLFGGYMLASVLLIPVGFGLVLTKYADIDLDKALPIAADFLQESEKYAADRHGLEKPRLDFSSAKKPEKPIHYFFLWLVNITAVTCVLG